MRKHWKCVICGNDIIEGQLFTFYSKGPVHWECWEREIAPKIYRDVDLAVLLRLDHYIHEDIVSLKELEQIAQNEETKKEILEIRRQLEATAAKLTNKIATVV
nr:DUF2175 domain-containing protein [Pyrobaculum islandicum]